ncbi:hypothetical protein D3C86_1516910 [compost metagenome]
MSVTPKIIRNSGISADDGVERKKSTRNSTLRYAFSLLPKSTPSGTPITPAMTKACSVRFRDDRKSHSSGPPARPFTKATMVALGVGNSTGLTSCRRTTRSQMMKSASGPISGRKRDASNLRGGDFAGAAPLVAAAGVADVVAVMDQPL